MKKRMYIYNVSCFVTNLFSLSKQSSTIYFPQYTISTGVAVRQRGSVEIILA
jgi:hypothetical protein